MVSVISFYSLISHCSGEFLGLLGKDLVFLRTVHILIQFYQDINSICQSLFEHVEARVLTATCGKKRKRWVCCKGFG